MTRIISLVLGILFLLMMGLFYAHLVSYYPMFFYDDQVSLQVLLFDTMTFPITVGVILVILLIIINMFPVFKKSSSTIVYQDPPITGGSSSGAWHQQVHQPIDPQPVSVTTATMNDHAYYYIVGEQQAGPVSQSDLAALWSQGIVGPGTYVWREGLPEWMPVSGLTELSHLLK